MITGADTFVAHGQTTAQRIIDAASCCDVPLLVSATPHSQREALYQSLIERLPKPLAVFAPDLKAVDFITVAIQAFDAKKEDQRKHDRRLVLKNQLNQTINEANREISILSASLQAHEARRGFFSRLFGWGKSSPLISNRIDDWAAKRSTAEVELNRLESEHSRLLRFSDSSSQPANQYGMSSDHAPEKVPDKVEWLVDPQDVKLYIATEPGVNSSDMQYEHCLTITAERMTDSEFNTIRSIARKHIIIGDSTIPEMTSPYRNGVPTAFRSEFFANQWLQRQTISPWRRENNRLICRLLDASNADNSVVNLRTEALADNSDIELRFLEDDETLHLAEVSFPSDWTELQAKEWLRCEYEEHYEDLENKELASKELNKSTFQFTTLEKCETETQPEQVYTVVN